MTYLDNKIKERLEGKLNRVNSCRPLDKIILDKIKERFEIEMTYNSNAIEGNRLTLKETYLVVNEGLTIKGKSLKDHLEAKNHQEALDHLYDFVSKKNKAGISEGTIRFFHQIVTQNTDEKSNSGYRANQVFIGGTDYVPPRAIEVPRLIRDLTVWIKNNKNKLYPIELAALVHYKLVAIHPFSDGNGRTARLIMNLILMEKGYPLSIILKNDRKKYYETLSQADKGDLSPFITFVARSVERSLDIYLEILTPPGKLSEDFITLRNLSKKSHFSAKYLNLLARSGKLEAHKKGRFWFSSERALERYLDSRIRKRK